MEEFKFRDRIRILFEVGLGSEDILGYHGTSSEAIQYLAKTGRMPASGAYGTEFYFAMITTDAPKALQLDHAETYANWNASKIYVLKRIPFQPSNLENFMYMWASDELLKKFLKEARTHGISDREVYRLMREADAKRKGVVISLSNRLKDDFEILPGESHDQNKITLPDGLAIDYITGIEPLGEYEWDDIERITGEDC